MDLGEAIGLSRLLHRLAHKSKEGNPERDWLDWAQKMVTGWSTEELVNLVVLPPLS